MKKNKTRLHISAETIRSLSSFSLRTAAGGAKEDTTSDGPNARCAPTTREIENSCLTCPPLC